MPYLADSTLLIDYYRKKSQAKKYFDKLKAGEITFSISVITEGEIWCGIKDKAELKYWMALLDLIKSDGINSTIARKAGELYKEFGHYMGKTAKDDLRFMGDAYIAATCIVKRKKLITGNYKHFKQLDQRGLIKCEKY